MKTIYKTLFFIFLALPMVSMAQEGELKSILTLKVGAKVGGQPLNSHYLLILRYN
jgi:hypothetical protein